MARIQAQVCLIPTHLLFSLCDTISKEKKECTGRIDNLSKNSATVFLIYFSSSPLICSFHLSRSPFHIAKTMHVRLQEIGKIIPVTDSTFWNTEVKKPLWMQALFPWLSQKSPLIIPISEPWCRRPQWTILNPCTLREMPLNGSELQKKARECPYQQPQNSGCTKTNLQAPLWGQMRAGW